jgi:hypothetical protein
MLVCHFVINTGNSKTQDLVFYNNLHLSGFLEHTSHLHAFVLLTDVIFKRSFQFTATLNKKYKDFSYSLHIHTHINISHQSATFDTTLTHHPNFMGYAAVQSCVVPSVGLDKYIAMIIQHCCIIGSTLMALKMLCVLLCIPPSPQHLLAIHLFTVSLVNSFPECHIAVIIHYTAFSDWLLLHYNAYFRFLYVFLWLASKFLFSME